MGLAHKNHRDRLAVLQHIPRPARLGLAVFALLVATAGLFPLPVKAQDTQDPIPLMAYYYIWFDVSSWNRAKIDYPLLGRYSSNDRSIMEQHVQMAKAAGISGFIVSWKSTYQLDPRLEQLMDVAAENNFYLWIIYQGLDFNRNPLPVDRITSDFEYFLDHFASHPAFGMYDRPVIIWSGTWKFSREEIQSVTSQFAGRLYILASEHSLSDYQNLADLVDGNAYYWSSVNPATFPDYQQKLTDMGAAIHANGGLWVAPAAPGFDARLIGGTTVVNRDNGQTLRTELDTALNSNPDAIGLISWNEFSENTHIEPSEHYGSQSLDVLMGREAAAAPVILDFDSSAPGTTDTGDRYPIIILGGLAGFFLGSIGVIVYRQIKHPTQNR